MNRIDQIYETVKERILVLDGAMGTEIQRHHLQEEDFRGGASRKRSLRSTSP